MDPNRKLWILIFFSLFFILFLLFWWRNFFLFLFVLLSLLFFTFCSVFSFSPMLCLTVCVAVLRRVTTFACFQFMLCCFGRSTGGAKNRIGCGGGGFFLISTDSLNFVPAFTLHPRQPLFCTNTTVLCSVCHPLASLAGWIAIPFTVAFATDECVVGCFGFSAIGTTKSDGVCSGGCFPFSLVELF